MREIFGLGRSGETREHRKFGVNFILKIVESNCYNLYFTNTTS